jgi:hypothetical protein
MRCVLALALFITMLAAQTALAAPGVEGFWRTAPSDTEGPSGVPRALFHIRQTRDIFVVEWVTQKLAQAEYEAREFPATVRDGILRIALSGGDMALGHDAERNVLVGGICVKPCIRIDERSYRELKHAALQVKGGIPKVDFSRAFKK